MPLTLDLPTNRRIVRASAAYDLVVTAPFVTPWTFALLHEALSAINQSMGGSALPAFEAFHVLTACLLGSVVMVWSTLRWIDATPRLGRFDGTTRFLFTTWMLWACVVAEAPVLWLFIVPEFLWGVMQWWPVRRASPATGRTVAIAA